MPQTTWATVADVLAVTGATVTDAQLAQANEVIEVMSDRLYSVSATRLGALDLAWMRKACAYQAAWMLAQPDMFERLEVTSTSQEGRQLAIRPRGLQLAPMARIALKRCSWQRSRSYHVRSAFLDGPGQLSQDPLAEANDLDGP